MNKKKLDENIQNEDGQVYEPVSGRHVINGEDTVMGSISCVGPENSDLDDIDDISNLKSMVVQLRTANKEQEDEIDYLTKHADLVEEENRLLFIYVERLFVILRKPWKPIPLPRWDKA